MSFLYFNPTLDEAAKMRELFDKIPEYSGIKEFFPSFDEALRALPETKKVDRIIDILRPIMADALCRVRGIKDESIVL